MFESFEQLKHMTNHREGSSSGKGSGFWGIDFATWLVNASVSENGIDCAICEIPKGTDTIRNYLPTERNERDFTILLKDFIFK